jgi:hypothetical protein
MPPGCNLPFWPRKIKFVAKSQHSLNALPSKMICGLAFAALPQTLPHSGAGDDYPGA